MIDFDFLEKNKEDLRFEYLTKKPFPYLVLDEIIDREKLGSLYDQIPELVNKSRDYVFANNKFEKSNYKTLGEEFEELYNDLSSQRMNDFLSFIACEPIFVDPKNHGGGLHQGKKNSFLDMHLDFNYHPLNKTWFRNMNLLLYLNKNWKPEYGGQLRLEDLRSGEKNEIDVPFNRLVIQKTRGYTLHGYDKTSFPEGSFRTSIATYAYTDHKYLIEKRRTTDWFPGKDAGSIKKFMAKYYDSAVKVKNYFFGSGTAKNQ
ncbi:2OG-Fe(II) oxygenase [Xanthovirga aplysinae]|uniref:2OG-Fe(II) oxygenase n=1 Tax=Xanthovirga aplysinae TaxID=2529853 RepID=UPI0012BC2D55|nr:2OG-Fe(II) oxygenase [Xanthovirga aplysinae]MTI31880.1 2OG-Fe(II) oxygenase [Xanthovirga aplysinae]